MHTRVELPETSMDPFFSDNSFLSLLCLQTIQRQASSCTTVTFPPLMSSFIF